MWHLLIEQAVVTLNLLRQSLVCPHLSTWAHCNGALNYDATPMGPMGCRIMINEPAKLRLSRGFHVVPGYYFGPAMNHYRCFTVFPAKIRSPRSSDTFEFRHNYITVPHVTPEDKCVNVITKIKRELSAMPSPI